MDDLAKDEDLHHIINAIYDHEVLLLLNVTVQPTFFGRFDQMEKVLQQGRKVTGYPDEIEPEGLLDILPFSLEQELTKIAQYLNQKAHAVWADDQIITSRDPFSSELMGEEVVKALEKRNNG